MLSGMLINRANSFILLLGAAVMLASGRASGQPQPAATNRPLPAAVVPASTNTPAATPPATNLAAAAEAAETESIYEDIALLTEAMLSIKHNYVNDLNYHDIVYGAIHGMLSNLDPHSAFLEPEETGHLKEDAEAHFVGIGIEVEWRHDLPLVIAPIEDSPAMAAGILSGDFITAINGEATRGLGLDKITTRLRGAVDTTVTVTIGREGVEPFDLTLIRNRVKLASIKGARLLPDTGVGYLRIKQFSEPTGGELVAALATLTTNELVGLILDLRDNPGGLFEQAMAVAVQFLPRKEVVVTTRGRDGKRPLEAFHTSSAAGNTSLPLVILINRNSASAAEIVAGALQDHGRALVLGERSFGKASVQRVIPLETREGCSIKVTTAHYYTPKGRLIHGVGIEPDIVVPLAPAQWRKVLQKRAHDENPAAYPAESHQRLAEVVDTQLQRATDLLVGLAQFRNLKPRRASKP